MVNGATGTAGATVVDAPVSFPAALAVPYAAVDVVIREIGGAAAGKTLVDASNALTPDFQLALGFTTSAAEELQKKAPSARVVKAFNTIFA